MPKIDFSDVKPLEPIPDGDYEATLTAVELIEKKASTKAPYLKLEFTVQEEGEFQGRKLFRNASLSPDSLWAYKQSMIALGSDPEIFEGELDPLEVAQDNIGNSCSLSVSQTEYEGRPQNKVNRIRELAFA